MLDISHTPARDEHVECVLAALPSLTALRADNCRKLSPAVASIIAARCHAPVAQLSYVSLQRCYQITREAVLTMLEATSDANSSLQAFATSHVDFAHAECADAGDVASDDASTEHAHSPVSGTLSSANATDAAQAEASSSSSLGSSAELLTRCIRSPAWRHASVASSLRVLALNSCTALSASALSSLLVLTPNLEQLMLGGCVLQPCAPAPPCALWEAVTAAVRAVRSGVRLSVRVLLDDDQQAMPAPLPAAGKRARFDPELFWAQWVCYEPMRT